MVPSIATHIHIRTCDALACNVEGRGGLRARDARGVGVAAGVARRRSRRRHWCFGSCGRQTIGEAAPQRNARPPQRATCSFVIAPSLVVRIEMCHGRCRRIDVLMSCAGRAALSARTAPRSRPRRCGSRVHHVRVERRAQRLGCGAGAAADPVRSQRVALQPPRHVQRGRRSCGSRRESQRCRRRCRGRCRRRCGGGGGCAEEQGRA